MKRRRRSGIFARLSVFVGGWTLAAAEAVGAGGEVSEGDVLDLLASLIDKSLVQFVAGDDSGEEGSMEQGRYRLLETIRQYGRERLIASGDRAATRQRHRLYFRFLAEEIAPALKGDDRKSGLDRLEADHENLRAALRHNDEETYEEDDVTAEDIGDRLRLGTALEPFWHFRGYLTEGYNFLSAALLNADACKGHVAEATWAGALLAAGRLALHTTHYDNARLYCDRAETIYRRWGDQKGVASALHALAAASLAVSDRPQAQALYEQARAIYRSLQDHHAVIQVTISLSNIARHEGRLEEARQHCEESLEVTRKLHYDSQRVYCLNHLAAITWSQGDADASYGYAEEALSLARRFSNVGMEIWALINLGNALKLQGDLNQARHFLEEGYAAAIRTGVQSLAVHALEQLAETAARQGDFPRAWSLINENFASNRAVGNRNSMIWALFYKFEIYIFQGTLDKAALLYGTLETLSVEVGALLLRVATPIAETGPESLRARLGDAAFEALQAQGRHLTVEDAIALARF